MYTSNQIDLPFNNRNEALIIKSKQKQKDKKREIKNYRLLSLVYIIVSLSNLCLLYYLLFISTHFQPLIFFSFRKQFTLSIFVILCVLGAIVGIYPSICSFRNHAINDTSIFNLNVSKSPKNEFKGHHPDCVDFSSHILHFREKTYCAGCTGLVIGAILSLLGSIFYLLVGLKVEVTTLPIFFWLGFLYVTCGLLQYLLAVKNNIVHLLLNILFVYGSFSLLIAVNEVTNNFLLSIYFLILVVYLIITRITLSGLEHKRICDNCSSEKCKYLSYLPK
jgi:hypothetical protein